MHLLPRVLLPFLCRHWELRDISPAPDRRFGGVEITAFRGGARAAASISADLELAWAWRGFPPEAMQARAVAERENVPRIVELLERHRIPITWATVGHLFLESCTRGEDGRPHPDMPRPATNFGWEGDWYRHDPCGDVDRAPGWICPDLIRLIQQSPIEHELATHSFSHIDFAADRSDAALVRYEMEACIHAMRPFGVRPRSLVYCFNHMGHGYLPLLASLGLTSVRHRDPARKVLAYPERTPAGVYKIYESMNTRFGRYYDYVAKAEAFLREAQKHQAAFHLWFHPSDPWRVFDEVFRPILGIIAAHRDSGSLWVATMSDLASYCEARATTELDVATADGSTTIMLRTTLDTARFGTPHITIAAPAGGADARVVVTHQGRSTRLLAGAVTLGRRPGTIQFDVPCCADRIEIAG